MQSSPGLRRQQQTGYNECCTSRQWHQEVWPGTVTTVAPRVTLAGASEVQAGHAYSPVSGTVCWARRQCVYKNCCIPVAQVAARHQLTVPRHRLSTYGQRAFAVAGPTMFCSTLCQMIYRSRSQHNIRTDNRWRHIFSLPISTSSALWVFHVMRYINVRYLLTYFLGCGSPLETRFSPTCHHTQFGRCGPNCTATGTSSYSPVGLSVFFVYLASRGLYFVYLFVLL